MIMTRMAAAVVIMVIMVIMVMIMVIMTMAGMRITWFLNVKGPSSYRVQEKVSSELSHVSCDSGREPTPDSV